MGIAGDDETNRPIETEQCKLTYDVDTFTIPQVVFNNYIADDGTFTIEADPSTAGNGVGLCPFNNPTDNEFNDVFVKVSYSRCGSLEPSSSPSEAPSLSTQPSLEPSLSPSISAAPSLNPSASPSTEPSSMPSKAPSSMPSDSPSSIPSKSPSTAPTMRTMTSGDGSEDVFDDWVTDDWSTDDLFMSMSMSMITIVPTESPSSSTQPSSGPTVSPSVEPSSQPSSSPSSEPSAMPSDSSMPSICTLPSLVVVTSNTPVPIPDGSGPSLVTLNVANESNQCIIEDVGITIGIDHTFVGDLELTLSSPGGAGTAILVDDNLSNLGGGGVSDLVSTNPITFDDASSTDPSTIGDTNPIQAGTFFSQGDGSGNNKLSSFAGGSPLGDWTFNVTDFYKNYLLELVLDPQKLDCLTIHWPTCSLQFSDLI